MKHLYLVLFSCVFGLQEGHAAVDLLAAQRLCPEPRVITLYVKNLQREFHSFIVGKARSPIKEVFIPETEFDVHPFVNNQGTLICSYAARGTQNVPLFHVNMGPISAPLGNIKGTPVGGIKPKGR